MLDLLLTSASHTGLVSRVAVQSTCFSDHGLVTCCLHVPCDPPTVAKYQYRDVRHIDTVAFQNDILQSPLYNFDRIMPVDDYNYVQLFNDKVQQIVDKHAPLKSRTRRISRNDCRWLSAEAREAKLRCWRMERRYRRSQSATDRQAFQAARATTHDAITRSRTDAIKQRFDDASGDAAATCCVVRDVLHRDQRQVHNDSQCQMLASGFSQFFIDKLVRIHQSIAASLLQSSGPIFSARLHIVPTLSLLAPTSAAEVLKLLTSSHR